MIPDYQTLLLPLLKLVSQHDELQISQATDLLSDQFGFTEEECAERLPSGTQSVIRNRTGWAKTYLKKAGLIEYVRRGCMRITARGKEVLARNPEQLGVKDLEQYPEFIEFKATTRKARSKDAAPEIHLSATPEDQLQAAYDSIRVDLESEILQQIKDCTPAYFEDLVVDLLLKMGYGGSREDAGRAVGKSGDGGIDGIIYEDRLGLDIIYIQAKKWENTVSRPEIQKFAGALQGRRARKGVFITTSNFSKEARAYAENIESNIVLIDGPYLAELMVDFDLGVSTVKAYEIKKIDNDYFAEE